MGLEREVEEGREKERQLERDRHDMERQITARSKTNPHTVPMHPNLPL